MKFNKMNRRHFLQGVGGAYLALPLLPSLLIKEALGQTTTPAPKFYVTIAAPHGGIREDSWYPMGANPTGLTEVDLVGSHRVRRGSLLSMLQDRTVPAGNLMVPGGGIQFNSTIAENSLSNVLGAFLNPYLSRINVIRGLDVPFYIGHHVGGYLGNFHAHDSSFPSRQDSKMLLPSMPTIDRVIARAPNFYGPSDPMLRPTLHMSARGEAISSDVDSASGTVRPLNRLGDSAAAVYRSVFDPGMALGLSLVDRVLADFTRLRSSPFGEGRRLSLDDKVRLDQHMDSMRDLERRIGIMTGPACSSDPGNWEGTYVLNGPDMTVLRDNLDVFVRLIVAMFACGYTRIATLHLPEPPATGDYHGAIAHVGGYANGSDSAYWAAQNRLMRDARFFMEHVFLNLIHRMHSHLVTESQSMLDRSLVVFHEESNHDTHNSSSLPTIMAGSAGGWLVTGRYIDYRNLSYSGRIQACTPGVPIQRWYKTVLDAFGVHPSVYSRSGMYGYGDPYRNPAFVSAYSDALMATCNTELPFLRLA